MAKKYHVSCLVKWVGQFPRFAGDKRDRHFETVLEMFRTALDERPGLKGRQVRQAIDAVTIYRYQFRDAHRPAAAHRPDTASILREARRLAHLKRCARSTRKNYCAGGVFAVFAISAGFNGR